MYVPIARILGQGRTLGEEDVQGVSREIIRELPHAAPEDHDPRIAFVAEGGREPLPDGDELRGGRGDPTFQMFREEQDAGRVITFGRTLSRAASARIAWPVPPRIP